jgi:hypothetical protein
MASCDSLLDPYGGGDLEDTDFLDDMDVRIALGQDAQEEAFLEAQAHAAAGVQSAAVPLGGDATPAGTSDERCPPVGSGPPNAEARACHSPGIPGRSQGNGEGESLTQALEYAID